MTELSGIISDASELDAIRQPTTMALQRIEAEARVMRTAYQLASSLSKTVMVPEQYQQEKNGEQAAYNLCAAIMYGAELGLSAVQAAQNIFIVRGKPAMYATTMAAIIRKAGYVLEPVEECDARCVWKGFRDGAWAYSDWSIERASQAGYTSNKLYQSNPQAMLRAKCITELARIKFQDCITGMAHSIEELRLESEGVTVQRVTTPAKKRGLAALREMAESDAPQKNDTPPPTASASPPPPDEPAKSELSKDTIKAIIVAGKANNINTLEELFGDLSAYLATGVSSWSDVSVDDADAYLASLKETAK